MPTSLQGERRKLYVTRPTDFRQLVGLLQFVFLLGCWRWLNKRAAPGVIGSGPGIWETYCGAHGETERNGSKQSGIGQIGTSAVHPEGRGNCAP